MESQKRNHMYELKQAKIFAMREADAMLKDRL